MGMASPGQALCLGTDRGRDPHLYGVVAALQPIEAFGRVYAAYGGVFIALALIWGVLVEGWHPDRYDVLGALIAVLGVVVMVASPRG